MVREALLVTALLLVLGACQRAGEGDHSLRILLLVSVTRVVDGDTFHVRHQGRDDRVRLIGVDAPEVSWYGRRGECFGATSAMYARSRLTGRSVQLAFDVNRRDRYGRLLAYVYLGSELFNLTLVRMGYALADPVPPDMRFARLFAAAEEEARTAGTGRWSSCIP